ncbi:MAG: Gfo/Idh/MocA family oxidoreductase [Deltaproteobacteria bacterium]|nr:MAG: Gfo/Idh/MocA family oxidoreductase [Deltaproteobacteria bacterium]
MSVDDEAKLEQEEPDFIQTRFTPAVGEHRQPQPAVLPRVVASPSAPRVGVVGVGYLGQFHAEKYAAMEEAQLVGVVDLDHSRARQIAERFSCRALRSHRDLIEQVDAVSVVVPTQYHYQVTRDLLEAGIHVLVEKPMTTTVAEADALISLAETNGLVLQVGHLERFNPAVVAASEHVYQPYFVESHRLASFTERGTEVDVILDLMIHDIDIILSLVPSHLEDLRVGGVNVLTPHTDIANVRLEFANGCIANVTASRISAKKMRKIRIFQPDSYLSIDCADKEVELFRKLATRGSDGFPEIEYQRLSVAETDPLDEQLRAFLGSVLGGAKPLVGGQAGRKALDVATRVSQLIQQQMERLGDSLGLGE